MNFITGGEVAMWELCTSFFSRNIEGFKAFGNGPPTLILGIAVATMSFPMVAVAEDCQNVAPIGDPPYFAEDYPLPLSLRVNLRLLMKRELSAIGRYPHSTSGGVFTDALSNIIRTMQEERGQEPNGCITWDLVQEFDSLRRVPPQEIRK